MKILFSDRALLDLEEIGVFIEKNAPEAARRHLQKLIERIRQLEQFPTSGRVVPEYQKENLRELVEINYVLDSPFLRNFFELSHIIAQCFNLID